MFIDRKVLFGMGVGIIIGVIFMFGYKYNVEMSDNKIEEKARGLGMHTQDVCKVYFGGNKDND